MYDFWLEDELDELVALPDDVRDEFEEAPVACPDDERVELDGVLLTRPDD